MRYGKLILIVVLVAFSIQGVYVLSQVGYWNIWIHNLNHVAGQQVFADLLISLTLVMAWMWHDARNIGRNVWPWIVLTLVAGSFGPLIYLLTRKSTTNIF
jgi:Terpene cyclase DEP1